MPDQNSRKPLLERLHLAGLVAALILLIGVAIFAYVGWEYYVSSADQTRRSIALIDGVRTLVADLQNAETSEQRFLLTGDPDSLADYTAARERVLKGLPVLNAAESEYKSHPDLIAKFRTAIHRKLTALEADLQLRHENHSYQLRIADINRQKSLMQPVLQFERSFESHQRFVLDVSRRQARSYAKTSQLTATLGCLGIFAIVLLSSIRIQNLMALRKRLNRESVRLTRQFQQLANSVPQLVWRMANDGEVEYLNQRWTELSDSRMIDTRKWQNLLHPRDASGFLAKLRRSQERVEEFSAECRLRDVRNQSYRWFLFRANPAKDEDSGEVKWCGTFTDIDGLKTAERALQRANKELEQFAYAAAHDLQEPLRNVATSLGLLQRSHQKNLDGAAIELVTESVDNAKRMHSMVKDLLAYSRAVNARQVETSLTDAEVCLQAALANLNTAILESRAEIQAGPLPDIRMEQVHLTQLFQNLISNSLKYRKPNGPVSVSVSAVRNEEEWIFAIADNGIGFNQEYADRIFGVFKRLHRQEYPGTGIGLAICSRIVSHYGGRIWAESTLGEGATFRFALPVSL